MSQAESLNDKPKYLKAADELRGNDGQWSAYTSTGNCVILAGPGSGKTKTLTTKMAQLLAEEIKQPRGMACITYSNECVRELKRRLDYLGVQSKKNVFIGTMHSFCYKNIILPYGNLAGIPLASTVKVANNKQKEDAFLSAIDDIGIYGYPNTLRLRMDNYRINYIDRDNEWANRDSEIVELIIAYEAKLREWNLVDFEDIVLWGVQLIEKHDWIRQIIRAKYPVLVIDEYQDLGVPLHRLVLSLCFNGGIRLIAVGDPDQSIYGFRGAKPELLHELSQMDGIQAVKLKLNYRCGRKIVELSQVALGEQREYTAPLEAHVGTIEFHIVDRGLEGQSEKICTQIIPETLARNPNITLGDIAVLYIDKNDGDVIANKVQQHGMEYIRNDQNASYPKTPLTRWLEDCAAWCSGGWREGRPRLSQLVNLWISFNSTVSCNVEKNSLKKKLVEFLWESKDVNLLLLDWLKCFDVAVSIENTLRRELDLANEIEAWNKLVKCSHPGNLLSRFTISSFAGQGGSPKHLNLYTLHSSKGLEFSVVIMIGMEQGRIPWINQSLSRKKESKRLFYVGLTRAKHEVHMTYSGYYINRGQVVRYGPSEFINELQKHLEDTN